MGRGKAGWLAGAEMACLCAVRSKGRVIMKQWVKGEKEKRECKLYEEKQEKSAGVKKECGLKRTCCMGPTRSVQKKCSKFSTLLCTSLALPYKRVR